ncbi:MAG: hypothetical protein ACOYOK_06580 [Pseudobdellovibrionaceae bacterium]|jgi:hypothetical protein
MKKMILVLAMIATSVCLAHPDRYTSISGLDLGTVLKINRDLNFPSGHYKTLQSVSYGSGYYSALDNIDVKYNFYLKRSGCYLEVFSNKNARINHDVLIKKDSQLTLDKKGIDYLRGIKVINLQFLTAKRNRLVITCQKQGNFHFTIGYVEDRIDYFGDLLFPTPQVF